MTSGQIVYYSHHTAPRMQQRRETTTLHVRAWTLPHPIDHKSTTNQSKEANPTSMSGVSEASLVLGLVSSAIATVEAAHDIYGAASDINGLPKRLRLAADQILLVHNALGLAKQNVSPNNWSRCGLFISHIETRRCRLSFLMFDFAWL